LSARALTEKSRVRAKVKKAANKKLMAYLVI
jgi:hypothetical protein